MTVIANNCILRRNQIAVDRSIQPAPVRRPTNFIIIDVFYIMWRRRNRMQYGGYVVSSLS